MAGILVWQTAWYECTLFIIHNIIDIAGIHYIWWLKPNHQIEIATKCTVYTVYHSGGSYLHTVGHNSGLVVTIIYWNTSLNNVLVTLIVVCCAFGRIVTMCVCIATCVAVHCGIVIMWCYCCFRNALSIIACHISITSPGLVLYSQSNLVQWDLLYTMINMSWFSRSVYWQSTLGA